MLRVVECGGLGLTTGSSDHCEGVEHSMSTAEIPWNPAILATKPKSCRPLNPKPQDIGNPPILATKPADLKTLNHNQTPKVRRIIAFRVILGDVGLLFYLLLGSRKTLSVASDSEEALRTSGANHV